VTYEIVTASQADLDLIARNMSRADADEVWATARLSPSAALAASAKVSRDTFVGLADGVPICAFGVGQRTILDDVGVPWLLGTPEISKHARAFLTLSKEWVEREAEHYSRLENWVDARHTRAVKWLKWLGFAVDDPQPYGVEGVPFHRFHMEGR
jgi:hypothetical protein